jgi:pyruvate ferredoxin oxidoreductase beta subunit
VLPLWEVTNGEYVLSPQSKAIALRPEKKKPVTEYLKTQRRFAHLFTPKFEYVTKEIQDDVDKHWNQLLKKCNVTMSVPPKN